MSIENTWQKALQIKESFRPIEQKKWEAREYAVELMVQIGHLGDILLRQDYKMNLNTNETNTKIIGDEIVDVILNTFSIADEQKLPLPNKLSTLDEGDTLWTSIIEHSREIYPDPINPITLYSELSTKGASILQNIIKNVQNERLTEDLVATTKLSARLADIYGVDIDDTFTIMQNESKLFIKRHTIADKTKI